MRIETKEVLTIDKVRQSQVVVGLHPHKGPVILRRKAGKDAWLWYILIKTHDYFDGSGFMTFHDALDWAVRNKVEMHAFGNHAEAYHWVADSCRHGE